MVAIKATFAGALLNANCLYVTLYFFTRDYSSRADAASSVDLAGRRHIDLAKFLEDRPALA